jgi:hypothetical protein
MNRTPSVALSLLAAALAACSDAAGPAPVTGTYQLLRYNAWEVPVAFAAGPCSQQIDAGTLQLVSDGTWQATLTLQNACPTDTLPSVPVTIRYHGTYKRQAASLRIWMDGTPEELPLAATDGTRLSLDLRPWYGAPTEYVREP